MTAKVDVRCPVCRQWGEVAKEELGKEQACPSCQQRVIPVPRPHAARRRVWGVVAVCCFGLVLFGVLYMTQFNRMVEVFGGKPLP
jgi:DNA-directed RNA polymerase subunit RPC12/RpoP